MRARIPMGPQGKLLRRRLIARTCAGVAAFTVCYLALLLFAQMFLVDSLANDIADATSEWIYLTEDQYRTFQENQMSGSFQQWDTWLLEDGSYAVRDLTVYYFMRTLKIPVAIAVYCAGLAVILLVMLNRALSYFNELSFAVTRLLADKSSPVELSPDLGIVSAELSRIRERSLADDRAAQAAETRKNELVAYLAHDIKTPLTSISGYLQLLEEAPELSDETRARYAGIALEKAHRLEGLMDEFFEITRYNLKSVSLERRQVDLFILCTQAAEEMYPQASGRGIRVEVKAEGEREAFVDPGKVARVLGNVLRNAVAYADKNSTISLRLEGGEEEAVIYVENEGQEISAEHLESIFEKFFREDGARSSQKGGAGLGLAIAREIAEAHGGSITAASENGRTTFTVRLPRKRAEARA